LKKVSHLIIKNRQAIIRRGHRVAKEKRRECDSEGCADRLAAKRQQERTSFGGLESKCQSAAEEKEALTSGFIEEREGKFRRSYETRHHQVVLIYS